MVDIIVGLLLVAGLYMGYKRGLIVQLFYLGTIVIGYIVSMFFSPRLAFLFTDLIPIPTDVTQGLEGVYKGLNIPSAYYRIVSFIVIFILIKIIIQILASILGVIRKLPLIKTTDRLLGAILGFLEIYLVVFLILYLVTVLPTPEWKTAIFTNSTLPEYILENTPILSKSLISLFFNK
ncbi:MULTISPECIES: CvpA family protein [Gemella]|uniref:CvpA family protein n=1 Tax=Gemella TaxID=1378 RepID=UPI00076842FD|nr:MULTISPECIES: CvpA family protein [Gemella]AME09634.1 colicin V production CvpA [Gemella sp. oral taxon 928]AXI27237.1 colicin V production CvpA [Gemella sp. ND 6198]